MVIILPFVSCQKTKTNELIFSEKFVKIVPENAAINIALSFNPSVFFNRYNLKNNSNTKSSLTGNNKIKTKYLFNDSHGIPALYIFNFEDNGGFLFVSADYQLEPILGYVEKGEFKKEVAPAGAINWVNKTMENIEIVRKGEYDNSLIANKAWETYFKLNNNKSPIISRVDPVPDDCTDDVWTSYGVGPLLPVTWGQGCTYNDMCPNLSCNSGCGLAWTGCVATSTAQIVNYWQPTNNFAYNYASMPSGSGNGEVQRLMRDLGNSVGMSYGCAGSGANAANVAPSLKNAFGFSSANFVDYDYQRVKTNLNNNWPVLLDGCATQTGHWFIINWWNSYTDCHEWVCDGYQAYNVTFCENGHLSGGAGYLYFHMNWGWHEVGLTNDFNGWFAFSNWNIPGLNRNYQYAQDLTSEIHP